MSLLAFHKPQVAAPFIARYPTPRERFIERLRLFGEGRTALAQFEDWLIRDSSRGVWAEGRCGDAVYQLESAVFELAHGRIGEGEVREQAARIVEQLDQTMQGASGVRG